MTERRLAYDTAGRPAPGVFTQTGHCTCGKMFLSRSELSHRRARASVHEQWKKHGCLEGGDSAAT